MKLEVLGTGHRWAGFWGDNQGFAGKGGRASVGEAACYEQAGAGIEAGGAGQGAQVSGVVGEDIEVYMVRLSTSRQAGGRAGGQAGTSRSAPNPQEALLPPLAFKASCALFPP